MSYPKKTNDGKIPSKPEDGLIITEELTELSASRLALDSSIVRQSIPIITEEFIPFPNSEDISEVGTPANVVSATASLNQERSSAASDARLSREIPVFNIARHYDDDSNPYNSRRSSFFDPSEADETPVITLFRTRNSFDYGDDSRLSINTPPTRSPRGSLLAPAALPQPVKPERATSKWGAIMGRLALTASKDERNMARQVKLNVSDSPPLLSSDESGEVGASNIGSPTETTEHVTALRRLSSNAAGPSTWSTKIYLAPNSPFYYMYCPFRKPNLANVIPDPVLTSSSHELPDSYPYSFSPVNVGSYDWVNIIRDSGTFVAVKQWTHPEPTTTNTLLPADVDLLVRYEVERMEGAESTIGDHVNSKELKHIQEDIALGQTPSGRKIDGYGSSGEEWIYARVRCKDEPDFDLFHHLDLGQEGKWPNPYYFYWDWKKLDDKVDVDEYYKRQPNTLNTNRANIVQELEKNPNAIPNVRLNANDTDTSDPEDPRVPHVTDPGNPFSLRWKFNEVRMPVTDPVDRRYPYMYLHLQGKNYNRYYKFEKSIRARKRRWYKSFRRFWDKRRTPWIPYPLWYIVWKYTLRHIVQKVPRSFKFLNEKNSDTIFYGTMASLYQTQYIAEYDVLPNMDDPVQTSQIALEKALKIKEKFISYRPNGKVYVDYLSMQKSKAYEKYLEHIGLLCRYQPNKMSQRVRKVFFLNFFNVLSIQTQIWRIPEIENMEYLWEMKDFWEKTKGLSGYIELNLEEIYHGILRCNRPHPTKLEPVFDDNEQIRGLPREFSATALSLERFDPRIHFALNIGCKSCPPIKIFSLYEQECELDEVAKAYVRSRLKIDVDLRVIKLPILFLWYEKDFGSNQRVLLWYLKRFLLAKDALKIHKLVTSKRSIYFRYERYDYTLEPFVRRHLTTNCVDGDNGDINRMKGPLYWGC